MIVVDEFNEIPNNGQLDAELTDWEEWGDRIQDLNNRTSEIEMAILDIKQRVKDDFPSMRGYSMVITKLDEAMMWLRHEARADVLRKEDEVKTNG